MTRPELCNNAGLHPKGCVLHRRELVWSVSRVHGCVLLKRDDLRHLGVTTASWDTS